MSLLAILDRFGLTRLAKMREFKGGDLFVNMTLNSKLIVERHLQRIFLCEKALRKNNSKERIKSLKMEIERRRLQLLSIGIDVDNPKKSGA